MDKAHKIIIALLSVIVGVIVIVVVACALMMVKHHKYSGKGYGKGGKDGRGQAMMQMDANDDGMISRDEYTTQTMERFDKLDADGDGQITREEMKAARKGKKGKRGKDGKGKRDK